MGIIFRGLSQCSICKRILEKDQRLVGTTHFIADKTDPLWRFSDSAMHYECFQTWPHRAEFVAKYNGTMGASVAGNGTRPHMHDDGVIETLPAKE